MKRAEYAQGMNWAGKAQDVIIWTDPTGMLGNMN